MTWGHPWRGHSIEKHAFWEITIFLKLLKYWSKTTCFHLWGLFFLLFFWNLRCSCFFLFVHRFCCLDGFRGCPPSRNWHYSKEGLTKIEDARVPGGSPRGCQSMPEDPQNGTNTKNMIFSEITKMLRRASIHEKPYFYLHKTYFFDFRALLFQGGRRWIFLLLSSRPCSLDRA